VGRTLTVQPGKWSVRDASFAYQWNRDGVPIEGATGERYVVTVEDAGAELTVTVTASAEGYADGTATTAGKSVALLDSRTTGTSSRLLVFGNQPLNYTVTVKAAEGVEPTGEVVIYDGSRELTRVVLEPGDGGHISLPIEGLDRGVHLLTARYLGNEQVRPSWGFPSVVITF